MKIRIVAQNQAEAFGLCNSDCVKFQAKSLDFG